MKCALFAPIRAVLRAVHAPAALPPIPEEMTHALASIDRLDRLATEKIERVRVRNIQMGQVIDDLADRR